MSIDITINNQPIERLIKKCNEELLAIISLQNRGDESKTKNRDIEEENLKSFGENLLKIFL